MEICDRKYMFGDKSTFGSSQNGQNMPKKGQQEKIFCTRNKRFKYGWEPFQHLKYEMVQSVESVWTVLGYACKKTM